MLLFSYRIETTIIPFYYSFRHPQNERVNQALVVNIKSLHEMEKIAVNTIESKYKY